MYPLNWKAEGRPCLVVGAGHVALRKVRGLLTAGARVTVLAPEAAPELLALAREGRIRYEARCFAPGDERGYAFIATTAGDRDAAEHLSRSAEAVPFLYNAADFPALGNCTLPAHFERGSLTVAVSTEGRSPAFARYIRDWLAEAVPADFGAWLDRLSALREEAKGKITTSAERERFWRAAFSSGAMALAASGHLEEAEEYIRNAMGGFGAES